MMREVFTTDEAAEMLGIHRVTLTKWLREGRVPGVKYSNVWRIHNSAMMEIQRHGVPPMPRASSAQ